MEQLKYIEVSDGYYKLAEAYSVNTRITGTNITLFDAGIELTEYGRLLLHTPYHFNGVNLLPDSPHLMRAAAEHDALTLLMQRGLLPMSYFDQVAARFKQVIIEDRKAVLPADVEYRDNPFDIVAWTGVATSLARSMADPANYVKPTVLVAPDPDWLEDA